MQHPHESAPRPERSSQQELIQRMSENISAQFDTMRVPSTTVRDGHRMRGLGGPNPIAPTEAITENVSPEGATDYEYSQPFARGSDNGIRIWTWQEGGNQVHYSEQTRLRGKTEPQPLTELDQLQRLEGETSALITRVKGKSLGQKVVRVLGWFDRRR